MLTPEEVQALKNEYQVGGGASAAVAAPEPRVSVGDAVTNYLKGFIEAPQKVWEDYKGAAQEIIAAPQEGAEIIARGTTGGPVKAAVSGLRGLTRSTTGAVGPAIGAAFSPIGRATEAVIPGTGPLSRTAQGALAGGVLGGPAGMVVGGGMGLAFSGYEAAKKMLLSHPKIAEVAAANPDIEKDLDNILNIGFSLIGQRASKGAAPKGKPDIMSIPVGEVPSAIRGNIAQFGTAAKGAARAVISLKDAGTGKVSEILSNTQNYIARKNAPENLATSVDRLAGASPQSEGAKVYHGTSSKDFKEFSGVSYFTSDPNEAIGFSNNVHLGGGRGGKPRVIESNLPMKKVKDVDGPVAEALVDGNIDEVIARELGIAKKEGYDTISFTHPSTYKDGEFTAYVPVENPKIKASNQKTKNPLELYDEFAAQEQKFKVDGKEDMALGLVGERIGTAYEKAVELRRAAGKRMEEEIKVVGGERTDLGRGFMALEEELAGSGLRYDGETGTLYRTKTSKVTSQDRKIVQDYITKLNRLGANPTAAELDAFLSRTPKELKVFKQKNNITDVTNGERIVKQNLKALGNSLTGEQFSGYAKAKSDYAALSRFLDEGAKFLGKETASGDFAKDASLAKSAVQSILNQGKKDWLLKLEDVTGYPAFDESVLAVQAMKDAGNFRGTSLLELLTPKQAKPSGIPTSVIGATTKAIDVVAEFGAKKFVGTPADQTRRVIMERMKAGQTGTPGQF